MTIPTIELFAARTDSGAEKVTLTEDHLGAVRASLVSVRGRAYPGFQRTTDWSRPRVEGSRLVFRFDRRRPFGEFELNSMGDAVCVRELTDGEQAAHGPILFVEALTYEFVLFCVFHVRLLERLGMSGSFRYGLSLTGFENADVDWAGLSLTGEFVELGYVLRWRFKDEESVVFQTGELTIAEPGIQLDSWVRALAAVVVELGQACVGERRSSSGVQSFKGLEFDVTDTERLVETILGHAGVVVGEDGTGESANDTGADDVA